MGEDTAITWCHHTFNPWWGCVKISPGCTNCYAAAFDKRVGGDHWQVGGPRRAMSERYWKNPYRWARAARAAGVRRRVFCASMADVFEDRSDLWQWRFRLWGLVRDTPELDWLFLTKRIENARRMLPWTVAADHVLQVTLGGDHTPGVPWPNVWLMTTAEDQERADQRIPILLDTPAAVRGVSLEPLLSAIDLRHLHHEGVTEIDALAGTHGVLRPHRGTCAKLDWVIVGDESGHRRRPAQLAWVRDIRDQCLATGTKIHLKQLHHDDPAVSGERDAGGKIHLPVLDGRQWAEFPDDDTRLS